MPTHTFIADSANEAVNQIRSELGPSAVVLSVRKLPRNGLSRLVKREQIEVVATVQTHGIAERTEAPPPPADFEIPERRFISVEEAAELPAFERRGTAAPSQVIALQNEIRTLKQEFAAIRQGAPGTSNGRAESSDIAEFLLNSGLLPLFVTQILDEVPRALRGERCAHLDCIENILRTKWRGEPMQSEAAVHLFIGMPGSGKSTVLCKMLAQTSIVEQQPASVYQLDSHIANSCGQTPIFSEIIGARFERTLPQSFERREESVFIDLPGVALGDEKGLRALRTMVEYFGVPEIHLVLNGAYEVTHLLEQVRFFANIGITDLIVSHLDEESRWGKIWNLVLGTNYSVRYLSCGQNVPGDLLPATAECLLNRQFRAK